MSDKFVLVVSDENDDKHGEISVLDSAHEAERLVETLLEAGFDQERIRVLAGSEAEFLTTYRPVVGFIDEANPTTELERPANDKIEPEATEVGTKAEAEMVEAHSGRATLDSNIEELDTVRLSSLFRSARDERFALSVCEEVA